MAGTVAYFNSTFTNLLSTVRAFDRNGDQIRIIRPGQSPIDVSQTVNIGKARIQGFEAEMEYSSSFAGGFLTPGGSISYLRGNSRETDEPLDTIRPLKTVLSLRWQDRPDRYYGEWTTRVVNMQSRLSTAFLASIGGPEPGFAVSDVRGSYNFKRERYRLAFNVGITNLFNRYFVEQFVLALARGRSIVFGKTWEIF